MRAGKTLSYVSEYMHTERECVNLSTTDGALHELDCENKFASNLTLSSWTIIVAKPKFL
jgi:hypothetical protein